MVFVLVALVLVVDVTGLVAVVLVVIALMLVVLVAVVVVLVFVALMLVVHVTGLVAVVFVVVAFVLFVTGVCHSRPPVFLGPAGPDFLPRNQQKLLISEVNFRIRLRACQFN